MVVTLEMFAETRRLGLSCASSGGVMYRYSNIGNFLSMADTASGIWDWNPKVDVAHASGVLEHIVATRSSSIHLPRICHGNCRRYGITVIHVRQMTREKKKNSIPRVDGIFATWCRTMYPRGGIRVLDVGGDREASNRLRDRKWDKATIALRSDIEYIGLPSGISMRETGARHCNLCYTTR